MKRVTGFTLMEMMVVLAIVAILATIAIPPVVSATAKEQVNESLDLLKRLAPAVELYQLQNGELPANNEEAGLPPPTKLLGNYIDRIELEDGAFHLHFGNKAVSMLKDKVISVRAIVVTGSPASPMSWVCAYSGIPEGMFSPAQNLSTVPQKFLPLRCRDKVIPEKT
ncbi:MAG: pilin [Moraxellaceae bacterium]|nr:pilin [Moraxellaceae bacterium]